MGLVWHFLKRILPYDIPLSAIGAAATWSQHRLSTVSNFSTSAAELAFRFVAIACTAGFALSFLLYIWLNRRELPLYTVCGRHLRWVAVESFSILAVALSAILAVCMVVLRWINP